MHSVVVTVMTNIHEQTLEHIEHVQYKYIKTQAGRSAWPGQLQNEYIDFSLLTGAVSD